MALDRHEMGDQHEVYLAGVNGGRKSRASGSQWADQGDGRNQHDLPFAFCWDGKSTRGKGLTITLEQVTKIREQAAGDRPQLGLRWYLTDDLAEHLDMVAVLGADWAEVLDAARTGVALALENERLRQENEILRGQAASLFAGPDQTADPEPPVQTGPPHDVPHLPWTVVYQQHNPPGSHPPSVLTGFYYGPDGRRTNFPVHTVRVERTSGNDPRLIVNDQLVSRGDLYVDGVLTARSGA